MNREKCGIKADFLQHPQRRLFYVLLEPSGIEAHSSILFLHPFADEMHKSRHIVASCARALAAAGHNVMLLDLSGCGDGAGDFADVSWQIWLEDARFALAALTRLSAAPVALWGLRTGALLACELSAVETGVRKLMMWQPVLNGEQQIDQFLRLRTVGTSATGTAGFDRKMLWCELRSGRSLEIVGYELPSALALEMAKVRLNDITPGCPVSWLEVASGTGSELTTASQNVVSHWRQRGVEVDCSPMQGEPFWRTIDAPVNPHLQQLTVDLLTHS